MRFCAIYTAVRHCQLSFVLIDGNPAVVSRIFGLTD